MHYHRQQGYMQESERLFSNGGELGESAYVCCGSLICLSFGFLLFAIKTADKPSVCVVSVANRIAVSTGFSILVSPAVFSFYRLVLSRFCRYHNAHHASRGIPGSTLGRYCLSAIGLRISECISGTHACDWDSRIPNESTCFQVRLATCVASPRKCCRSPILPSTCCGRCLSFPWLVPFWFALACLVNATGATRNRPPQVARVSTVRLSAQPEPLVWSRASPHICGVDRRGGLLHGS